MSEEVQIIPQPKTSVRRRNWWKNRTFLLVSVGLHLLFGLGAAYVVVSHYSVRKLTFNAGPKSPNPSERAIQHRVQLHEKMKNPPAVTAKRILSGGVAKIALPPLPELTTEKN